MTPPTGTEWLSHMYGVIGDAANLDPNSHAMLLHLRNLVLDGAAAGDLDLSLPLHVTATDSHVFFTTGGDALLEALL